MGWISSVPSSFGGCLEECIKQISEDNGVLLRESFRKILARAARDWSSIASSLNSNKIVACNLHKMDSKINDIDYWCNKPLIKSLIKGLSLNHEIDWLEMLKDVRIISGIVLHEMQYNLVSVSPDGISNIDKRRKYESRESLELSEQTD